MRTTLRVKHGFFLRVGLVGPTGPLMRAGLLTTLLVGLSPGAGHTQQTQDPEPGRIAGQVVDEQNGRPIAGAQVVVVEAERGAVTDVAGRFRTAEIAPGLYAVQVANLGYATVRVDSVRVDPGATALVYVALPTQAVEIEGIVVAVEARRASSDAGLLALQKAAPVVSDGVSAEFMARTPDSDAGDAIARVTGVSVVDDKFVVVRGLAERYSNTLLNGSALASPEPTRRIVPLDVFPASLLESVVTNKTATPDMPGNFAGGSVDIRTKDFPEQRVFEVKVSQGGNANTTFERLSVLPRAGLDWLAWDGADRSKKPPEQNENLEAFAESLRNVWIPEPRRVLPDLGVGLHYGDQVGTFERALGYVFSVDYGRSTSYDPADYFAFIADADTGVVSWGGVAQPVSTTVDWGVVANAALRLSGDHVISLKNLITREAEEFATVQEGFDPEAQTDPESRRYQVRYIERSFLQSQLAGVHLLPFFGSTLDWKASFSMARRDEPENRSLNYLRDGSIYLLDSSEQNAFWFRFLDDRIVSGQLDWSVPVRLWQESDAVIKAGGLIRVKRRDFDAELFDLRPTESRPDGTAALSLPPAQVMAPENIGRNLRLEPVSTGALPYEVDDELRAGYLMLDLPVLPRLRAVGGLRVEQWMLDVLPGSGSQFGPTSREENDYLWSANLTYALTDAMNFRVAGYQTLSRPDPRELTENQYVPVVGECKTTGNPELTRVQVLNADVRWEWYPAPGELISLSGFYKEFEGAIVEAVRNASLECVVFPVNAPFADNFGGELELRKSLGFLGEPFEPFSLGVNFTYVDGGVEGGAEFANLGLPTEELPLQNQSRYLVNASLIFAQSELGLGASVLYNYFDDRVRRYGIIAGESRVPDVVEVGRGTLDMKLNKRLGERFSISISGENLTDEAVEEVQATNHGPVTVGLAQPGVSFSVSFGYGF